MKSTKTVRMSGMIYESLVNGPGMRRVFFAQGCKHNCKGCFNPETHPLNGGEEMDMDELIKAVEENPMIKGITFSGGDPFEQAESFSYMAEKFKNLGLNIWCYTGYRYEEILEKMDKRNGFKELIQNIDVLVDGEFDETKRLEGLKYRGSENQRIIDVKESFKNNKVITLKY